MSRARSNADAELLARAALLHATDVRPAVMDRTQAGFLEEARAALGDGSRAPALACVVLARLSTALQPATDPMMPAMLAREALARVRTTGDEAAILDVLDFMGFGIYATPLPERVAHATELLERGLAAGDRLRALRGYAWLAFHRMEEGDFDAFDRVVASMLALSEEIGHPRHRWVSLLLASTRATVQGFFAESDRYVTEVAQLAGLIDDPSIGLGLALHDLMRLKVQRRDELLPSALARLDVVIDEVAQSSLFGPLIRGVCMAHMGDLEGTRSALAAIGTAAQMVLGNPNPTAYLGEIYALVGSDDERRRARDVLSRAEAADVMGGPISYSYEGTFARVIGLLDASLGELSTAETQLRRALDLAVARRQPPWIAKVSHELASVVRRRGREEEARELDRESLRIARELGMTGLEADAHAGAEASPPALPAISTSAVAMSLEGEVWTIARGDARARIKDSRGVRLLARLVERPGEELHVLALASDDAGANLAETNAGDVIDERARRAYRTRIAELDTQREEAEQKGDAARAGRLDREKATLAAELARATGLGGRARVAGSATERARVNVQRRVKDALARIAEVDAGLGRFFERAVSTGTFCCFRP
jgi:hypothetical protein